MVKFSVGDEVVVHPMREGGDNRMGWPTVDFSEVTVVIHYEQNLAPYGQLYGVGGLPNRIGIWWVPEHWIELINGPW